MKKVFLLGAFVFSFFLVSCSSDKNVDMTFEDAYGVFRNSDFQKVISQVNMSGYDNILEHTDISFSTDNEAMSIGGEMILNSKKDLVNLNSDSTISFDIVAQDKINSMPVSASGFLNLLSIKDRIFVYMKDTNLDMGQGRAEANLINMMIQNFSNQWVYLDYQDMLGNDLSKFSFSEKGQNFLNSLGSVDFFVNMGKMEYEGKTAYKVDLNSGFIDKLSEYFLSGINELSGVSVSEFFDFEGMLVVQDLNNVDLIIQNISFDSVFVGGKVGKRDIVLEIENKAGSKSDLNINLTKKGLGIKGNFVSSGPSIGIDFLFSFKKSDHLLDIIFDGNISVVLPDYGVGEQVSILYNFEGNSFADVIEFVDIKEPNSYVLMSQILGDPYSMSVTGFSK